MFIVYFKNVQVNVTTLERKSWSAWKLLIEITRIEDDDEQKNLFSLRWLRRLNEKMTGKM